MDRSTAVTMVQRKLGFRTDQSSVIIDALQDAQLKFERGTTLPWFLITDVTSITTTSGSHKVTFPTDFLREYEEDALWYFDSAADDDEQWNLLKKDSFYTLRQLYPGSGVPVAYAIHEGEFFIFPEPDAVYTLKLIYYKKDTLLTTDVENDWLKYAPFV